MDLFEMRAAYRAQVDALDSLVAAAEAESRDLTDEEQQQYDTGMAELETLRSRIRRLEAIDEARAQQPEPAEADERDAPRVTEVHTFNSDDFRNFGEFVHAVRFNPSDQRLAGRDVETRADLEVGTPAQGGYLVPEQFMTGLLQVAPNEAVIRPRARVIPAGNPPDGKVNIPALDQSGTKGVYSGVTVTWIAEGAEKPETNPTFTEIELEPNEVAAHTVLTDKLIRNAPVADSIVRQLLREAIIATEDMAFLSGTGTGQPTGLIGHASNVEVQRAVANEISYADVVAMFAAALTGGNLVWLASRSTLPQLMTMTDDSGQLVWQTSARDDIAGTLFGIPVVLNNRQPALGTEGDLVLADLQYYLIKDGSPLAIAASPHVYFTSNKTVIKAFWAVDGQPQLTSPIQAEDGTSVSPFVTLTDPAV